MSGAKESFESNLKELENVVGELENSEISLDDMLNLFEKGVKLTKKCSNALDKAEQKITQIMANRDGELVEVSFPAEN